MLTESTYVCKSKFLFHANTDRGSAGYGTSEKAVQINIVLLVNRIEPAVGCNRQIFLFCFEMLLSKQKTQTPRIKTIDNYPRQTQLIR